MISKNELKYYSSLLIKKFRNSGNKFLAEGKKIVAEGLNSNLRCELVFVTHDFHESESDFMNVLKRYDISIEILKNSDFVRLSDTRAPQGIAAVFEKTGYDLTKTIASPKGSFVCLENISDPGNMGTIIRNCDWFGITEIIADKTCADIYNPKVIRASAGSVFHVKIYENADIFEILPKLKNKGYRILCADIEGENIFEFRDNMKSVLILANEANGPSMRALNYTDTKVTIPRIGKAESLNVASASAIILSVLTLKKI